MKLVPSPIEIIGRNPGAGVAHRHHDIVARLHALVAALDRPVGQPDRQLPARGHRIAGVESEVHDQLLDLHPIRDHGPALLFDIDADLDIAGQQPAKHLLQIRQSGAEIEQGRGRRLLARESQQLPRQIAASFNRLDELHDIRQPRIVAETFLTQHFGIDHHHDEKVVEVVGDPACEHPDRLHLLRLPKLLV